MLKTSRSERGLFLGSLHLNGETQPSQREISRIQMQRQRRGGEKDQKWTSTHLLGQVETIMANKKEGSFWRRSNLHFQRWGAVGGLLGSPGLGDHGPWGQGGRQAHTWRRPGGLFGDGNRRWLKRDLTVLEDPLLAQRCPNPLGSFLLLFQPLAIGPLLLLHHQAPRHHGQLCPQPSGLLAVHCSLSASALSTGEEEGGLGKDERM